MYGRTASASFAGIFGMPSMTRLSPGGTMSLSAGSVASAGVAMATRRYKIRPNRFMLTFAADLKDYAVEPTTYGAAAGTCWPLPPGPIAKSNDMTYTTIAPSINTMAAQNHQLW